MIAVALAFGSASAEQTPNIARGEQLARANCARCHSIDKTGQSSFPEAPPFRSLHRRYAVESLQEALGEGLFTGHPEMPEFEFTPDQIGDFLAFLKSLE